MTNKKYLRSFTAYMKRKLSASPELMAKFKLQPEAVSKSLYEDWLLWQLYK